MRYLVVVVAVWAFLAVPRVSAMAEDSPSSGHELTRDSYGIVDEEKQEATWEQVQPSPDRRLTKEQLRNVIRTKRDRVRTEMKARRESLRAEGAELQQEIMAKKARMHIYPKDAAEVIAQPAN